DPDAAEQILTVRAEDRADDGGQPRGKQDWELEPHGIWYERTTGIWQPVWLERVPDTYLAELQWTPDVTAARVRMEIRLNQVPTRPLTVRARLRLGSEVLAEQTVRVTGDGVDCDIALPLLGHNMWRNRLLWSPESPTLIDADVTVLDDEDAVDEVTSYLGLRSVGYGDGRFTLNGKPYYLRLVLEQGYWPESHLAAPNAEALRREVELIKDLGFNGARIHQKVEDPRFLYWCDRLGLLIWGEMANAYQFSDRAVRQLATEWQQVVRRDRSHPCVVTWVPLNESWGVVDIASQPAQRHYATALYHLTKALDPTRPVISNDGWEHTESDIWGVHDYAPVGESLATRWADPEQVRRMLTSVGPGRKRVVLGEPEWRGQPVVLTEFGGLSYAPEAGQKWFGYGTVETEDEFLELFTELVAAIADSRELAGFCYTQLTDTLQERNGLLDEHRNPKLPIAAIREAVTRPSRSIPAELVDVSRRAAERRVEGRR
ncbi:MAG: glycoside hydrolase family 2 protein, partial [Micromonosporaceae bacterium]